MTIQAHEPTQATRTQPTPERILQLGLGFWGAKTLLSAVELGVFSALADGPQDGESQRQPSSVCCRSIQYGARLPASRRPVAGSCSRHHPSAARRLSCSLSSRASQASCSLPSSAGSARSASARYQSRWRACTTGASPASASRSPAYWRTVSSSR